MTDTSNLALPTILGPEPEYYVTHNEALRLLDTLVQLAVLDRDLAAPPASPNEGERWIVAASPTGAWAGHGEDIAAWQDGAWQFSTPQAGWVAFVADEGTLLVWNGSAWGDFFSTVTSIQNLALLGVGTTADAANPFAAKLNNTLWVAKTAAEGGDGDLRYKLSKEGAADVLSLLMQTNFSGRAELGLIGDDDLTVKVSPDGSAWNTALVADRASGAVTLPNTRPGAWGLILPQTRALVAAMTAELRRTRAFLIDDTIAVLIDAGVWAKLDVLQVYAAGDSQAALLNWINPAGPAGSAVNSPTFTVDEGFAGDGSTSYVDAGVALNALTHYQLNSASLFAWSLTDADAAGNVLGTDATPTGTFMNPCTGGDFTSRINDATSSAVAVADSLGLFTLSRGGSGSYHRYKDGVSLGAASVASTMIPTGSLVACRSASSFSNRRIAVLGAGAFLSSGQIAALHAALLGYLTEVGAV